MSQHTLTATKYTLCAASALFTALFAAGFAGYKPGTPLTAAALLPLALPVAVGLAIDACKFKFWPKGLPYKVLSLVLLLFSWGASVAFFIGQSEQAIAEARTHTAAYAAHAARVGALQQRIELLQQQAAQNAKSVHWARIDKATEQSEKAGELGETLAETVRNGAAVGRNEALATLPSAAFFAATGGALGLDFATVRGLFYGLLALLIEVCALAAIAATQPATTEQAEPEPEAEAEAEAVTQMRAMILAGHVSPTHAALRAAGFGNNEQRQQVIGELVEAGALEPAPRNSWRLAKAG